MHGGVGAGMRHRGACACAGVPFRVAQRGCGGRAHGCDAPIRRERRPDAGGVGGQVISAASLPSVARGLWLAEAEAEPGGVGGGWPSQSGPRRGCLENASDCACSAADSWQAGVAAGGWAVAVLAALGGGHNPHNLPQPDMPQLTMRELDCEEEEDARRARKKKGGKKRSSPRLATA